MRKILSFLALLVVGFVVPQWAHAWDYSAGTNPSSVSVYLESPYNEECVMSFANSQWTTEFTAKGTTADFKLKVDGSNWYGYNLDVPARGAETVVYTNNNDGNTYHFTGLTNGTKYKVTLTGNNSESCKMKVEAVSVYPDKVYLYDTYGPKQLASASADANGVYTFEVDLTTDKGVVFSLNGGATTWAGINANNGRYNPASDTAIPGSNISVIQSTSGALVADRNGKYTIKLQWGSMNVTATCVETTTPDIPVDAPSMLYIYSSAPQWATRVAAASPSDAGVFKYTVTMAKNTYFVLSTKGDGVSGYDSLKGDGLYTPADDQPVEQNVAYSFGNYEKAWKVPADARYTITVDWSNKTLKATWEETTNPGSGVRMPLTTADFANGKKHYFLVGERCGEWRLQPEWELTVNGNTATLNNRFMYDGFVGVAVVDNYSDYTVHKYTMYKGNYWFQSGANGDAQLNYGGVVAIERGSTYKNPFSNDLKINYNGWGQQYWDGNGQFVSEIKVTLNGDVPSTLAFTPDSDNQAANRVFTLCGDNIYNRSFSIANGGATYRSNLDNSGDGWQEGWIQYDPATNRPYVDGHGEYLYLTSYTPDYMQSHPVYFNMTTPAGDFQFTNSEIQFVEASKLSNLDDDPYKEFYSAFSGREEIKNNGAHKEGEKYNFNVNTANGETWYPGSDWHCYVIRDMWMGGQYKFWSGWGGNVRNTNGNGGTGATWHGPNGGPNIDKNGRQQALGYDIESGQTVVLYKNAKNVDNTNYKTGTADDDKTPKYYNRVVLWYNEHDGVAQSFLQLVQESAGPAIFAKVVPNDKEPDLNNYIDYNWYLNKAINDTDRNKLVYGYRIERYRVVDNKPEFIGYPEGERVKLDTPVTVESLYEGNDQPFTKYHDTGIVPGDGFAPGVYQYKVYVYYNEQMTIEKEATSNKVVIYGNSYAEPDAVPLQIIELRDAYTDHYGTKHESGIKHFGENNTKKYLTYREDAGSNFYLFNINEEKVTINGVEYTVKVPADAEIVDSEKALELLNEHPDRYWWTSDYYVRCLDYNAYETSMQRMVDAMVMKSIPEPLLIVREKITTADNQDVTKDRTVAKRFEFGDKTYYSAIVGRGGNLADAVFNVELNYTFEDYDGNMQQHHVSKSAAFDPVTPRPFDPLYRYVYTDPDRDHTAAIDGKSYGKILTPHENWNEYANTTEAIKKGMMKDTWVKMDNDFATRTLTLQVDFYRPNVNKEIYQFYDIQYNVEMNNNANGEVDVPMVMEAVLHDVDTSDANFPNRYRMEFKGMHPRDEVYPTVKFVKTEYVPNQSVNQETGIEYKSQTGNFGKMLTIEAKHNISREKDLGFTNVHLGKIKRKDGTWDWMYKGHEHFQDAPGVIKPTENEYEDVDFYNEVDEEGNLKNAIVEPFYYLIELSNTQGDKATYEFLVPHKNGHNDPNNIKKDPDTGLLLNDTDPLIGTYIAKGFSSDEAPTFHATAMYLFERSVHGFSEGDTNFNRLEVESIKFTNPGGGVQPTEPEVAAKAARAKAPADLTNKDLENGNVGGLPDAGSGKTLAEDDVYDMSAPNAVTGYNGYIAIKGAHYTTSTDQNVTGVEDVLAGYEDGEVVYYNLQGVRVAEPTAAGVYLKVQGKNVTKIVVE